MKLIYDKAHVRKFVAKSKKRSSINEFDVLYKQQIDNNSKYKRIF